MQIARKHDEGMLPAVALPIWFMWDTKGRGRFPFPLFFFCIPLVGDFLHLRNGAQ
jgi:hypothetical protein